MTQDSQAISAALERAGMAASDIGGRVVQTALAIEDFRHRIGRAPAWAWWVPGRIEVFGKHTDYAGGRSLVAAVPRGFALAAGPRADRVVTARDARWRAEVRVPVDDRRTEYGGWSNYIAVVVRRLGGDFPGADLGTDIVFASDLPRAAGVSSSSALVVGIALALIRRAALDRRDDWRHDIRSGLDLAGYLGAVENGLSFGSFRGTPGVGTHGGSEDHTAILNSRTGVVSAYAYVPVRLVGEATLPAEWRFAVMSSGVEASKAGEARDRYNRASLSTQALVDVFSRYTGRRVATLAEALSTADPALFEEALLAVPHSSFPAADLRRRLAHFVAEDGRVPLALAAIQRGDRAALGALSAATQIEAETLLGNQIPETSALAGLARDAGAFAASSFGAGFGGSVWALVPTAHVEPFAGEWLAAYARRFPARAGVEWFAARPSPALIDVGSTFPADPRAPAPSS